MKIVIKIGGALVAQGISTLIEDLAQVVKEHEVVLVHGGGPQITALGKERGKEAKYFKTPSGMPTRYTDKDQMENVKMALAGFVNKNLVEACQKAGINAFGFTGLDGRTVQAKRKEKIMVINDKGKRQILRGEYSGKVEAIDPKIILWLLEQKYLPIIGSMSCSQEGDAVNVDGDRVAIAVADSIHADLYLSLTDVPGIYKDMETKELFTTMTEAEAQRFLEKATGGMKKKIYAALEALKGNIKTFTIYSGKAEHPILDVLNNEKGTRIVK